MRLQMRLKYFQMLQGEDGWMEVCNIGNILWAIAQLPILGGYWNTFGVICRGKRANFNTFYCEGSPHTTWFDFSTTNIQTM